MSGTRSSMMTVAVTVVLCVALGAPGCASTRAMDAQAAPQHVAGTGRGLMADYAQRLPVGSRVRATTADGRRIRGTLMRVTPDAVAVQPRTRLPEPPVEIPIDALVTLEPDPASNMVRTVAIGAASGVAAALGVFAILAAIFAGD